MKNNSKLILLALCATMMAGPAFAQFDTGGSSKPWSTFKLPKKSIKLDFKNSNIDMVLSYFSKVSGITIVKDPTLKEPITLSTASAVSMEDAFAVLSSALSLRKYELQKDGKILVVRARPQQGRNTFGGGGATFDPSQLGDMMGGQSQLVLKVYQLKNALASAVAKTLNDVYQQQATLGGLPFGNFGGGGNRFGGGGGRPTFNFGGQSSGPNVRASSDDYSNSVIVNASSKDQKQVEELIKQLDKVVDDALKAQVYKLNYAFSDDLVTVVQGVLTANAPKGRGGGASATPVDQRFSFFPFGGGGNRTNQNTNVVSEPRTNSLVVTTTEQNHELIAQVIKQLDQEIKYEPSTFVIPLDNARADQMATLLQNAFGRRQGVNGGGNNNNQNRTTQNGAQNRNNNNQNRNNGGGFNGGGLGGNNENPNEIAVDLANPSAEYGELQTNINVADELAAQIFGGFGQQNQNQNRNNQNRQTVGRDAQGRLVNTQDLTNQVTIIPDTNTNTVIVVGSPEQAELLRKIIAQLDKIPEQVMIETIIVEATLDQTDKLGVDWKFVQNKAFGNTGTTGTIESNFGTQTANGQGFRYTLTGGDLSGFINALKSDSKFQILSTPRIFTSNNVNAEINISQRVPYVTSQRTDANGNITFNYAFEDVGIVLNVTPRITAGGYVTMEVLQTANDLQGFTSFNAPIVNQRQADTTVAVKDGETIILGGIIRSTVNSTVKKIPLLGDIPILGNLFKSTDKTKSKTELMVFLTPRVVRTPEDAAKLRIKEQNNLTKPTQDDIKKAIGGGGEKTEKTDKPPKEGGGKP